MKMSRVSIILVGAVLVFSSGIRAGETNKAKLHLADKVMVEGKAIDAGDYTVEWTGSGPAVEVSLSQGKHTIATFPAHVTEQPTPNAADAYASTEQPDGSKALVTIYFGGKRTALELEETSQQSSSPGAR
jgi:3-keto-L-gulonate-6-phosphate decarboxylase